MPQPSAGSCPSSSCRRIVRNWDRIGTSGQTMMQTFDDSARAGEAFDRLERTKHRRGYAPAVENR